MRKFTIKLVSLLFTFYILHFTFYISPAQAACVDAGKAVNIGECFGFGKFSSLGEIISRLVPTLLSVAGVLVVLYFLWGAFKFLISGGDKEAVAAARGTITNAIIGVIILMFAFVILQFLLSALFGIKDFQIFG